MALQTPKQWNFKTGEHEDKHIVTNIKIVSKSNNVAQHNIVHNKKELHAYKSHEKSSPL